MLFHLACYHRHALVPMEHGVVDCWWSGQGYLNISELGSDKVGLSYSIFDYTIKSLLLSHRRSYHVFTVASCFVILYFVPANEFSFTRCALERNDGNPC